MDAPLEETWTAIRGELRRAVTDSTYEIWLTPLRPRALDGDTLVVAAPDEIRSWVSDRFQRVLQTCAAAVLGPAATVQIVAPDADLDAPPPPSQREAPPELNPKYVFDQFVIGDGNRLAHAAALAVAELPGQAYNPLFIYGAPGLGKTHLLHAIGNYLREFEPGLAVRYTTAEGFTNDFLTALGSRDVESFKTRYRRTDVLLIDDVQFLQRKARTEDEFFHTFNALHDTGAQLVLTCDRMPRDMDALAERLRERFESGLVTDIAPPDRSTRLTILRKRALHDGIELDDPSVLELIADRIDDNVRSLEGALIRVVAYHSLTGRPIDGALVTEVLDGLYGPAVAAPGRRRTIADIQALTCEAFGITLDELLSDSRAARVAWPRQVAMYLAREHTDQTLPAIGREFGHRNHTTVLHACRRTGERIAADADAYDLVRRLSARITSEAGTTVGADRPD